MAGLTAVDKYPRQDFFDVVKLIWNFGGKLFRADCQITWSMYKVSLNCCNFSWLNCTWEISITLFMATSSIINAYLNLNSDVKNQSKSSSSSPYNSSSLNTGPQYTSQRSTAGATLRELSGHPYLSGLCRTNFHNS